MGQTLFRGYYILSKYGLQFTIFVHVYSDPVTPDFCTNERLSSHFLIFDLFSVEFIKMVLNG